MHTQLHLNDSMSLCLLIRSRNNDAATAVVSCIDSSLCSFAPSSFKIVVPSFPHLLAPFCLFIAPLNEPSCRPWCLFCRKLWQQRLLRSLRLSKKRRLGLLSSSWGALLLSASCRQLLLLLLLLLRPLLPRVLRQLLYLLRIPPRLHHLPVQQLHFTMLSLNLWELMLTLCGQLS